MQHGVGNPASSGIAVWHGNYDVRGQSLKGERAATHVSGRPPFLRENPSKPAPYSPNLDAPIPGDNLALVIEDQVTGQTAVYAPGLGAVNEHVWHAMQSAACVLVDGTFWADDEMVRLGISRKHAPEIGHLPQSGPAGMLEWLDRLPRATRKVLIHINNTNPILDENSAECAELARRGIEVAWDGMEILL